MELIKITEQQGQKAVSARELYKFLEVETRFDIWIKRMFEYGFAENVDYQCLFKNVQMPNGGFKEALDDYALTLDCAKEISMLQRTEKGQQARRYFIEMEKQAAKPLTQIEMLLQSAQILADQERQLKEVKTEVSAMQQDIKRIEARQATAPDYFSIMGYCILNKINCPRTLAVALAKKVTKICKERNILTDTTPDPRFGKVKLYPYSILEEVIPQYV